ncbi:PPK2 family polyphosphate kinase [Paenibacillus pasadenensis]|uniref:UDP-galactose-lipid carrier transferase n=1 Tax=Paenibacillus pasadenensis TaxID=217090 RepID=A0A2N5N148_9BACL|nr:PPK2 family polyphosphate kinase [Paenibacillus pasadenensis]PLT44052.1 UDP-galactose-lipid carrier transferase [Paenibacillus pasadenensis]
MNLNRYRIGADAKLKLKAFDPADTNGIEDKKQIEDEQRELLGRLEEQQERLFASRTHGVLIVFQGMDCSGKDGVIKKVFRGIDPGGFRAYSFKKPTDEEAQHDFLWRTHRSVPARGCMTAFNRSYYEEALITRVHGSIDDKEARRRLKAIRHFEEMLESQQIRVLKFFLHISPEFQLEKIRDRMENPEKWWKFDPNDLEERKHWKEYQSAYEDAIRRTATDASPWHVVPSDNRWFRNYVVLRTLVEELEKLELSYPQPHEEVASRMDELRDGIDPGPA